LLIGYKLTCSVLRTDPLAYLKHAASVHPGLGSNPQISDEFNTLNVKTNRFVFTLPVIFWIWT